MYEYFNKNNFYSIFYYYKFKLKVVYEIYSIQIYVNTILYEIVK